MPIKTWDTNISKSKLSEESTDGRSDLESKILVAGEGAIGVRVGVVDVSDHGRGEIDGEDVIRIFLIVVLQFYALAS